jgi:hypothetical protein
LRWVQYRHSWVQYRHSWFSTALQSHAQELRHTASALDH